MKTVISMASMLACAFSLDAQITITLNGGEVRIKNNSSTGLVTFVVTLNRLALLFVALVVMLACSCGMAPSKVETENAPPRGKVVLGTGGALCGEKELATRAYHAVRNGDKAGIVGLVSRGEITFSNPELL